MIPPDGFDRTLSTAILDRLAMIESTYGAKLVQPPGMQLPADRAQEEWIAFNPLSLIPFDETAKHYRASFMFQVTAAARLAELRHDKDGLAPWALAGKVRAVLDPRQNSSWDVLLYPIDPQGIRGPNRIGVLSLKPGRAMYLSQRMGAASGVQGGLGVGVPANYHAVALTYRGYVFLR